MDIKSIVLTILVGTILFSCNTTKNKSKKWNKKQKSKKVLMISGLGYKEPKCAKFKID